MNAALMMRRLPQYAHSYAGTARIRKFASAAPSSSYLSVPTCPEPTCTCQPMPQGLDIDYKRQLNNSVAPYSDHLLIHTGTADWPSRIEEDARFPLAAELKAALKRGVLQQLADAAGAAKRPANVLVSNSSLAGSTADAQQSQPPNKVVVSLMQAGLHLSIDSTPAEVARLVDVVLAPTTSRNMHKHDLGTRLTAQFNTTTIQEITVLICGHGKRDERCGIMGPLLQHEFRDKLARKGIKVLDKSVAQCMNGYSNSAATAAADEARVGMVSHIGGHVFAGNVILYVPPIAKYVDHPLAGKGVWYGRVQPKHVEGIVEQTIKDGVIIDDLLRGVV